MRGPAGVWRKLRIAAAALGAAGLLAAIPPRAAGAITDEVKTTFSPQVHGYHFPNVFTGDLKIPVGSYNPPGPIPSISLGTINFGTNSFGLCGGMSAGAADNFNAGTPAPATTTTPVSGTPLYGYLYARQVDSLVDHGKHGVKTLILGMVLPEKDVKDPVFGKTLLKGVNSRTQGEIKKAKKKFAQDQVVPILLVKTGVPSPNPANIKAKITTNHQVLGIGYFKNRGQRVVAVWDPNLGYGVAEYAGAPATDPEATDGITYLYSEDDKQYSDRAGTHRVTGIKSTFRGFFRQKYDVKTPVG
ncbi:MAG: hypothetical protein LC808_29945 [Actinobacteria bacterium]|nr:hypothetical protein [Actinomycetota bacterium]